MKGEPNEKVAKQAATGYPAAQVRSMSSAVQVKRGTVLQSHETVHGAYAVNR